MQRGEDIGPLANFVEHSAVMERKVNAQLEELEAFQVLDNIINRGVSLDNITPIDVNRVQLKTPGHSAFSLHKFNSARHRSLCHAKMFQNPFFVKGKSSLLIVY